MSHRTTALVTGATSGIGLDTARQLVEAGSLPVIMTGRTIDRAQAARTQVSDGAKAASAIALALDLDSPSSIRGAGAELRERGTQIDLLILNAGMMSGPNQRLTGEGIEQTFAASVTGHHVFTMELLAQGLLSPSASIVISGSEAARGDVPTMGTVDLQALAERDFGGDLMAAAMAMIRGEAPKKFRPNQTYSNAKMFVAWWAAALARRLPEGMSVNAVSPGATPATEAGRHKGFAMRRLMMPMMSMMPNRLQLSGTTADGARRYLDIAMADEPTTGHFYASAPKKMHGPLHRLQIPRLTSAELQEAAWEAICATTQTSYPTKSDVELR